jgi:hypothetical protein
LPSRPRIRPVAGWRSFGGVTETNRDEFSVGYCAVYASAFVAAILGSVFVTRIRSVP